MGIRIFHITLQKSKMIFNVCASLAVFLLALLSAPAISSAADFAGTLKGVTITDQTETSQPPIALISTTNKMNGTYDFDARASSGSIIAYNWTFWDGSKATGSLVNHAVSSPGSYQVQLELRDSNGAVTVTSYKVNVP